MADGTIVIDTEIDSSDFGKALDGYSEDVKKVATELYDLMKRQKEVAESHRQNTAEVQKTSAALDRLIEKQIRYTETGGKTGNRTFAQMEYDIERANAALTAAEAKQAEAAQSLTTLNTSIDTTSAKLQTMVSQETNVSQNSTMLINTVNGIKQSFKALLPTLARATKGLFSLVGRGLITGVQKLGAGLKKMATHLTSIHKGARKSNRSLLMMLGSSLLFSTVFRAISALINSFKEGVQNLAQYSSEANASMSALKTAAGQLKNSLATAFMPLITIITPALVSFINMLNRALTAIGAFFSALSGKSTFIKAIAVQQDYASSLDKTASSAKKAEKAQNSYTSSLDELNIISKNEEEADMGGAGGGGPASMFEEVPISDSIKAFADKLKEIFNKIKEYIKNEDWDGLGEYLAEGINIALEYLYDALNWENVKGKVMPFITAFTQTFNSLVDNVNWELIGQTIGTGFNTLVNILYELITGIDWGNLGTKIGESINGLFSEIDWTKAGSTLGEAVKGLLDLFIKAIEETDWQQIGNSVAKFIGGIDWSGIVNRLFEGIGAALGGLSAFLIGLIEYAWGSVVDWWHEVAFEDGQFTIQGLLDGIWSIAQNIGKWLMENVVNPFIDGFKEAFGINSPSTVMAEFGVFIMQGLIKGIESLVVDLTLSINKIKESILKIFKEVKESVIGIWDGIVKGIKSAVNGIIGVINGMISGVAKGINAIIDLLNNLSFDIPDWVPEFGGKTFGFDIPKITPPKIPYLATGAVIPPNAPFMAMLGDQTNGRNLEAPEDLIRQIVREEAGVNTQILDALLQIAKNTRETADKDLIIGDREIARANLRGQNSMGFSLITEG